jgi:hypothetical protein
MLWCHISHTTNALLFKFRCNIFICVRIIKEMPGWVASGTPCTCDGRATISGRTWKTAVCLSNITPAYIYREYSLCMSCGQCWSVSRYVYGDTRKLTVLLHVEVEITGCWTMVLVSHSAPRTLRRFTTVLVFFSTNKKTYANKHPLGNTC